MESHVKALVEEVLEDPVPGVNAKLDKIVEILKQHSLATEMQLKPQSLLVHPSNRGGSMVNAFDVHRKGANVLQTGLKRSLLASSSVCIEMARQAADRKAQIFKNQTLVAQSGGLLGEVLGKEQYLTLGGSHWLMFCRAMQASALSPNGEPLHTPLELQALLAEGWTWLVLKAEVEESFPSFPGWAASSLNSSNHNARVTSELEAMLEIASMLKQGKTVAEAVEAVKAGLPACGPYLGDIGHFVKLYAGGDQFPLLQLIKDFCTKYGPSILIGQEMMFHLSHFDFKMENNKLPMTRAALLCTMLTSKKHADGLSRLVYKADMDKMKGTLKGKTRNGEDILKKAWEECQKLKSHEASMAWGKLGTRLILHLLGKEKYSRDAEPFASVADIVEKFGEDLQQVGRSAVSRPSDSQVSRSSSGEQEVKDLLQASASELALLDHPHLKLGGHYTGKDHDEKVFAFSSIKEDHMVFSHTPIFGGAEHISVPFSDLKDWRATKRSPPKMCPEEVSSLKVAQNNDIFKMELKKAQLQLILLEAFQDHVGKVHESLVFASMPGPALFTSQKLKKGQLVLYPLGTVQSLKGKDLRKVKNMVLDFQHEKFGLQTFKNINEFDAQAEGMLVPYQFVQYVNDDEDPNMEVKLVNVKGVKIPVLSNCIPIPENTMLTRALLVENDDEKQAAEQAAEQDGPVKKKKRTK